MDKSRVNDMLKGMDIFKNVRDETISGLANKAFVEEYDEKQVLFLEGSTVSKIYIIYKGKAIVSRYSEDGEEKIIHILKEEGYIHDMGFDNRKTSSTVTMMKDSKLIAIDKKDALYWMEKDFEFCLTIINFFSDPNGNVEANPTIPAKV